MENCFSIAGSWRYLLAIQKRQDSAERDFLIFSASEIICGKRNPSASAMLPASSKRRGKPEKYLADLEFRVGRLISDCGWNAAKDVSTDSFQSWLRGQNELNDKTANDYSEVARRFFNWLVRVGGFGCNPLLCGENAKTKEGKAHEVGAFSDEMLRWLAQDGLFDGGTSRFAEIGTGCAQMEQFASGGGDTICKSLCLKN
jgi:hypothetical protein